MHVRDGRPAENNGIAALQLHSKLIGDFLLHSMFLISMYSNLNCTN